MIVTKTEQVTRRYCDICGNEIKGNSSVFDLDEEIQLHACHDFSPDPVDGEIRHDKQLKRLIVMITTAKDRGEA